MKNILTIDFDIIMDESINLYNSMSEIPWEERYKKYPILKSLPIEANHYQKITQFLIHLYSTLSVDKIHFISQHHFILNYLKSDDQYNITNIDHHHDWAYKDIDFDNPINEINCGNWAKTLFDKQQLLSYTWIKNERSIHPQKDQTFISCNLKDYSLFNLLDIDEVYIVFSPEFVPTYYYKLFYIWMDIANTIYNTHFEIDDKKR